MSSASPGPDSRPLGHIALGAAVLSGVLAVSYLLSPLAFLPGALAVLLGTAARGVPEIRRTGTAAVVISLLAMATAAIVIATYG